MTNEPTLYAEHSRFRQICSAADDVTNATVLDFMLLLVFTTKKIRHNTIRYDTIRDAILTCARKPT